MTRKGELIGEVIEYFVDQDSGHILGMQLKLADKEVALASESVVTYGKDIIIVKEDATSYFLNSVEELEGNKTKAEDEDLMNEVPTVQAATSVEDDEVKALKEKQIELLVGKTITKDIYDKNGSILFYEGTVLTTELIQKAQEEGPSIVVELSMNIEA